MERTREVGVWAIEIDARQASIHLRCPSFRRDGGGLTPLPPQYLDFISSFPLDSFTPNTLDFDDRRRVLLLSVRFRKKEGSTIVPI